MMALFYAHRGNGCFYFERIERTQYFGITACVYASPREIVNMQEFIVDCILAKRNLSCLIIKRINIKYDSKPSI